MMKSPGVEGGPAHQFVQITMMGGERYTSGNTDGRGAIYLDIASLRPSCLKTFPPNVMDFQLRKYSRLYLACYPICKAPPPPGSAIAMGSRYLEKGGHPREAIIVLKALHYLSSLPFPPRPFIHSFLPPAFVLQGNFHNRQLNGAQYFRH